MIPLQGSLARDLRSNYINKKKAPSWFKSPEGSGPVINRGESVMMTKSYMGADKGSEDKVNPVRAEFTPQGTGTTTETIALFLFKCCIEVWPVFYAFCLWMWNWLKSWHLKGFFPSIHYETQNRIQGSKCSTLGPVVESRWTIPFPSSLRIGCCVFN